MCRTNPFHPDLQFQRRRTRVDDDNNSLKIKAFYVRLSGLHLKPLQPPPQFLSLLYLPRCHHAELSVDGSKVRPHDAAFLELHRVLNAKTGGGEGIFGSIERVRASHGVRFEVYLGDERILDGCYGKDDDGYWTLECKCGLRSGNAVVTVCADVAVAVEGQPALSKRVEMAAGRREENGGRRAFKFKFSKGLEAIPEAREDADYESKLEGGCSCDCGGGYGSDGGGDLEEACGPDCTSKMEMDLEGVRWAVDVGIWIMCLGMGLLVSKASSSMALRRMRII